MVTRPVHENNQGFGNEVLPLFFGDFPTDEHYLLGEALGFSKSVVYYEAMKCQKWSKTKGLPDYNLNRLFSKWLKRKRK